MNSIAHHTGLEPDGRELGRVRDAYLEAWTDILPRSDLRRISDVALDLGRIGRAAAWARALEDVQLDAMDGYGGAPAGWLVDLVERLDRRCAR